MLHTAQYAVLVTLAGIMVGCGSDEPAPATTVPVAATAPVTRPPSAPGGELTRQLKPSATSAPRPKRALGKQSITFGHATKIGESQRFEQETEASADDQTAPARLKTVLKATLTSAHNGVLTWKVVRSDYIKAMGGHQWVNGGGPDKNRLMLMKTDSFNNLISWEGADPDWPRPCKSFPTKPVRLYESWEGYTIEKGKRYKDIYTLEAIATVNDKRLAIVSKRSERSDQDLPETSWIEIATGTYYKQEIKGTMLNEAGEPMRLSAVGRLTSAEGRPLLP